MSFVARVEPYTRRLGVVFVETEKGKPKGVEIKELKQNSPLTGQVECGDVLLAVNGEDVQKKTLKEVTATIVAMARETDAENEPRIFTFARDRPTVPRTYRVEVEPNTIKLGIVFVEIEKGKSKGVVIKEVKERSPLNGQTERGDVLLEVNGEDVRNKTLKGVMSTIVRAARKTDAANKPRIFTFARDRETGGGQKQSQRERQETKEEEEEQTPQVSRRKVKNAEAKEERPKSPRTKRKERTSRLLSAGSRRVEPAAKRASEIERQAKADMEAAVQAAEERGRQKALAKADMEAAVKAAEERGRQEALKETVVTHASEEERIQKQLLLAKEAYEKGIEDATKEAQKQAVQEAEARGRELAKEEIRREAEAERKMAADEVVKAAEIERIHVEAQEKAREEAEAARVNAEVAARWEAGEREEAIEKLREQAVQNAEKRGVMLGKIEAKKAADEVLWIHSETMHSHTIHSYTIHSYTMHKYIIHSYPYTHTPIHPYTHTPIHYTHPGVLGQGEGGEGGGEQEAPFREGVEEGEEGRGEGDERHGAVGIPVEEEVWRGGTGGATPPSGGAQGGVLLLCGVQATV
jgi:hypothetical protein